MKKFALPLALFFSGCGAAATSSISAPSANDTAALAAQGYVQTPHGYYHQSCVHEVADDATVDASGNVTQADGTALALPECEYPHVSVNHQKAPASSYDGWIEYASWTSSAPATKMTSNFVIPKAPAASASQLVYFFPGMQPADDTIILQPVLQWGDSPAGGGAEWGLASWSCGSKCVHSKLALAAAGDTILGTIAGSKCTSAGACNWKIVTKDVTSGKSSTLNTTGDKEAYVWLVPAVLETYGVTACNQYPANDAMSFTDVVFSDASGNALSPSWSPSIDGTLCTSQYKVTASGESATLKF